MHPPAEVAEEGARPSRSGLAGEGEGHRGHRLHGEGLSEARSTGHVRRGDVIITVGGGGQLHLVAGRVVSAKIHVWPTVIDRAIRCGTVAGNLREMPRRARHPRVPGSPGKVAGRRRVVALRGRIPAHRRREVPRRRGESTRRHRGVARRDRVVAGRRRREPRGHGVATRRRGPPPGRLRIIARRRGTVAGRDRMLTRRHRRLTTGHRVSSGRCGRRGDGGVGEREGRSKTKEAEHEGREARGHGGMAPTMITNAGARRAEGGPTREPPSAASHGNANQAASRSHRTFRAHRRQRLTPPPTVRTIPQQPSTRAGPSARIAAAVVAKSIQERTRSRDITPSFRDTYLSTRVYTARSRIGAFRQRLVT